MDLDNTTPRTNTYIIFTRGIPASGKSTWSKEWAMQDPLHRVRICLDDIRRMFGKYWVVDREPLVADVIVQIMASAIEQGYDIVLDGMNLNKLRIDNIIMQLSFQLEPIDFQNIMFMYRDFPISLNEAIVRDSKREGDACIGEKGLIEIWNRHAPMLGELRDDGVVYIPDEFFEESE